MKALITGGAGFVGSHLAETLLAGGWMVEVIDDLSTGSIDNISHLKEQPGFSYVLDSVMHRSLMLELVDRADVVFHLAAAVGVRLIVEEPVRTDEGASQRGIVFQQQTGGRFEDVDRIDQVSLIGGDQVRSGLRETSYVEKQRIQRLCVAGDGFAGGAG